MKVILDTNFIIYCAKEKLDYIEELADLLNEDYEIIVPEQVVKELEKLKNDKMKKVSGKDKDAADLGLKLIEFNKIKQVKVKGKTVDEGIVNLSKQDKRNIICTLDREMRHKLPRVILLNKNKKLILTR